MLTETLENVLNRGLPRSPRARQLCRELQGHRVGVEVSGFTRLVIESTGETLQLTRDASAATEAEISGGPLSLLALAGESPEAVLQRGDVQIRGDVELAQKFRELALLLRPDIEEEVSKVVGDVPAHHLGRVARAAFGWTRNAASTSVRNVAEYLAHERQHLVPRAEADQLLKGVDTLRENVDRLEARIELLTRKSAS
ncbi:MAG: SCP2 sterol-binding domain-containing protein [Gammaproteobacteria bacterium]